jgi:hypothetical protein
VIPDNQAIRSFPRLGREPPSLENAHHPVLRVRFCVSSFSVCVISIREVGFTVVGIDYFFGDPVHLRLNKPGFDRLTWRTKSVEQAKASVPK